MRRGGGLGFEEAEAVDHFLGADGRVGEAPRGDGMRPSQLEWRERGHAEQGV